MLILLHSVVQAFAAQSGQMIINASPSSLSIPVWIYPLLCALLLTALLLFIFVSIYKRRIKRGERLLKEENEKLNALLLEKRKHEKMMREQETRLDLAMEAGDVSAWIYEPETQEIRDRKSVV